MKPEEIIFGLCTIFISIIALIYSIREVRLTKKHNVLTVKPILNFSLFTAKKYERFSLKVLNVGLGPALITDYSFYIDNLILKEFMSETDLRNWEELSKHLSFPDKLDWHFLDKKTVIKSGDEIELVGFEMKNYDSEIASKFRQAVRRLKFEIEYTSIYGKDYHNTEYNGVENIKEEKINDKNNGYQHR